MIWYLPIELLEERYTAQMFQWVREELEEAGADYRVVLPGPAQSIERGQFLDVYGTIRFKAQQIAEVARQFQAGNVQSGDKFLIGDLWFPGVESIRYMADLTGIEVGVWGWHYAGCADPWDFVRPLRDWARHSEYGWLRLCEGVFVGSHSHKFMMQKYFDDPLPHVHPIGLVWNLEKVRARIPDLRPLGERPKRIIFPHRCAPEKNPEAFYGLAAHFVEKGWDFVITSSRKAAAEDLGFRRGNAWRVETGLSKQEYYEILADSRVMFSAAHQETFGYTVQEAIALGVGLVVPNRLSYPEVLESDSRFLYDGEQMAWAMVEWAVENPVAPPLEYSLKYDRSARRALELMDVGT